MSSFRTELFRNYMRRSSSEPSSPNVFDKKKSASTSDLNADAHADEEGSDSEDDFISQELDRVGRSVSFSIPNFPEFSAFKLFTYKDGDKTKAASTSTDAATTTGDIRSISDFLLDQQLSQIFNKRRDQLTEFINDLSYGFSINNAAERLAAFRDVVQSTVELPVSDYELDEEKETEPHGVVSAKKKVYPIIDELVIPETNTKKRRKSHGRARSKSLSRYNHLTELSSEEYQDESLLRSRIKKILSAPDIPDVTRNKLVQKLMMKSYYEKIQKVTNETETTRNLEKMSLKLDNDVSSSEESDVSSNDDFDDDDGNDEVILSAQDLIPSYHSQADNILGCAHYQRNCKIECSICNKWYPCRFCHDQEITSHQLPRPQTKHVLCMFCSTPQLPSQICVNESCGKVLSHYYCDKCKLFDNDLDKDIYHCDDCGICRLGQGLNEDFFHCKKCNACISIDLQDHHRCIENSTHSNCTICGEYMFSSIKTVVFMQCGHPIHQSCFDEHTKHSYKCPVCSRSIINMEAQFRVLDQEISLQPLPEPYGSWKCIVQCNDCKAKSVVGYHILGLKCENCKSYNTAQLKLMKNEKELAEAETDQQQEQQQSSSPQQRQRQFQHEQYVYEERDDRDDAYGVDAFQNLMNNGTLISFDRYRDWFFSTMDTYLSQGDKNDGEGEDGSSIGKGDDDLDDYEEDDYDDMR